jgi:hypothetical protein
MGPRLTSLFSALQPAMSPKGRLYDVLLKFPPRNVGIRGSVPAFWVSHTHMHTHHGAGIGDCGYVLLYFSTKRETPLSICTNIGQFNIVLGRLAVALSAEILL